ncbi:hypothetical protein BHM03_00020924 [Ensete ventricosum]|uniref:Uncharacterized protein n=1 Tax=Ensete ventricosum TaxID=4639 RepID=A0A445MFW5_ENSVE|nr:hypothetical protein BHM03_00020924 [Ensete ventricosum]
MKRSASEVDGSSTRMATKGGTKLIPKISMAPIRAQRNSKRTRTKVERKEDFLAKDRTFGAHGKGTIAVGKRARRSDGDRETKLSLSPFLPLFLPPSRCCPTDGSVVAEVNKLIWVGRGYERGRSTWRAEEAALMATREATRAVPRSCHLSCPAAGNMTCFGLK